MTPTPQTFDLRAYGDLASVIARQAPAVLSNPMCVTDTHAADYWRASRTRSDVWGAETAALTTARRLSPKQRSQALRCVREVLTSELVTRMWTAILVTHDRRHDSRVATLAWRVFERHQESRLAALRLMTRPDGLTEEQVDELDGLRRRAERWTDCLLASVSRRPKDPASAMAFDAGRLADFVEDAGHWHRMQPQFDAFHLSALAMRADAEERDPRRGELHRGVLEAIAAVIESAPITRSLPFQPLTFRPVFDGEDV